MLVEFVFNRIPMYAFHVISFFFSHYFLIFRVLNHIWVVLVWTDLFCIFTLMLFTISNEYDPLSCCPFFHYLTYQMALSDFERLEAVEYRLVLCLLCRKRGLLLCHLGPPQVEVAPVFCEIRLGWYWDRAVASQSRGTEYEREH
jgi:hypothetical protein